VGSGGDFVPERDDTAFSSVYLQYFGFDFTGFSVPADAQTPQIGLARSHPNQPFGTQFAWSITGASFPVPAPSLAATQTAVVATQPTLQGGIAVRCTYRYTYENQSFQYEDDSEQTPPPGSNGVAPAYYRFTGHMPAIAVEHIVGNLVLNNPAPFRAEQAFRFSLYDQNGALMPGVWIQESLIEKAGVPVVGNARGGHWITGRDGYTTTLDVMSAHLALPWTHAQYPTTPLWSCTQILKAGTTNPEMTYFAGVQVRTSEHKAWTDYLVRF
jgi:hypothetical protein